MNKSQWEAGGNGEDCCILVWRISFGPFVCDHGSSFGAERRWKYNWPNRLE